MSTYGARKDTKTQRDEHITDSAGTAAKKTVGCGIDNSNLIQSDYTDSSGRKRMVFPYSTSNAVSAKMTLQPSTAHATVSKKVSCSSASPRSVLTPTKPASDLRARRSASITHANRCLSTTTIEIRS